MDGVDGSWDTMSRSGSASERITVTEYVTPKELILHVEGEFDAASIGETGVALLAATKDLAPPALVVVDLTAVTFMSAAAVHVLRKLIIFCGAKGVPVHLVVDPNSLVRRILDIALPADAAAVFATLGEACRRDN